MSNPRTAEYLFALTTIWGDDVKIEAIETETDFGTKHYSFCVYIKSEVLHSLKGDKEQKKQFLSDGGIAVPESEWVFIDEDLDDAISSLFYHFYEKQNI